MGSSQDLCLRTRPTELGPTLELDTVEVYMDLDLALELDLMGLEN
jgi:hypothetical protein